MIYLDTSALVKLVVREVESSTLLAWLRSRSDVPLVTSALGRVELMRVAVRAGDPSAIARADDLLDGLDTVRLSDVVMARAERIGPPDLRSLDAIHLASALELGPDLASVVVYDRRLATACRAVELPCKAPGRE